MKLPEDTTTSQGGWPWCGPPTTRAASARTRAASTSGTRCRTWSPPAPTPQPSLLTSQCSILLGKVCLAREGNLPFSLFFLAWLISVVRKATKENLCGIVRAETLGCDIVYEHPQAAFFFSIILIKNPFNTSLSPHSSVLCTFCQPGMILSYSCSSPGRRKGNEPSDSLKPSSEAS